MREQDVKRERAMATAAARGKKRRRRVRWQFIAFALLLMVAILVALCLTVLFPVRSVTVQGESRYTAKEITDVAAIEIDSNLILLDEERATGRVLEQLPFIGNCELEKKLDGRVILTVSELPGVNAYQSGGKFYIVNEKNKVLEAVDTEPESVCVIVGVDSGSVNVGQTYTPNEETAARAEILKKLADSITANELTVTRIDVSEEANLRFVVENRIMVKFGSIADLEYKMAHLNSTLKSMSSTDEGTLDLTWWTTSKKDAYFRRGSILEAIYGEDYVLPEDGTSAENVSSDVEDEAETSSEEYTEDPDSEEAEDEDLAEEG